MKKFVFSLIFILCASEVFSMNAVESFFSSEKLKIATTTQIADILNQDEEFVEVFQQESGVMVEFIAQPSASDFADKIKNGTLNADILLGAQTSLVEELSDKFADSKIFEYTFLTFCFDTKSGIKKPESLRDFQSAEYYNKIILVDPRNSNLGLDLLKWSIVAFGPDDAFEWWKKAISNSYTLSTSWHSAYSIFLRGDAPIVVSYSTTPIAGYMGGESTIESLNLREGSLGVDEYICILKNSPHKRNAKKFFDYCLKNSYKIAIKNNMYPVQGEDNLPDVYQKVTKPTKILSTSSLNQSDQMLTKLWSDRVV